MNNSIYRFFGGLLLICLIANYTTTNFALAQDAENVVGGNTADSFSNISEQFQKPSFSGAATYSIKLFDVPAGGDLDFPITISYNSDGIKQYAKSGIVGYGWNINFNNEVSRNVKGVPDEQRVEDFGSGSEPFDLDNTISDMNGLIQDGYLTSGVASADEWDQLSINTPYHSSKIVTFPSSSGAPLGSCYGDKIVHVERPFKNWVIACSVDNLGYYDNFQIIDDKGRFFNFDHPHYLRITEGGQYYTIKPGGGARDLFYYFPISWKLTQINSPTSSNNISYEYTNFAHQDHSNYPINYSRNHEALQLGYANVHGPMYYMNVSSNLTTEHNGLQSQLSHQYAHLFYDLSVVQKIVTPTHIVEMVYITDDKNTGVTTNYNGSNSSVKPKLLKWLYLKQNNTSEEIVKTIEFVYNQVYSSRTQKGVGFSQPVNILEKIIIKDVNGFVQPTEYKFSYKSNATTSRDPFGYYGENNLLDIITLPSGGTIQYEYENRNYEWYFNYDVSQEIHQRHSESPTESVFLAGKRVSSITLNNQVTDNDVVYTYDYGDGIRYEDDIRGMILNDGTLDEDGQTPWAQSLNGNIGHRDVKVITSDGGFTKTYFTNPLTKTGGICNYNESECPTEIEEDEAFSIYAVYKSPFIVYENYSESYGLPYRVENGVNTTLDEVTSNSWGRLPSDYLDPGTSGNRALRHNTSNFFLYRYKTTTTQYFDNETEQITKDTYFVDFTNGDKCSNGVTLYCRTEFSSDYGILMGPKYTVIFDEENNDPVIKENHALGHDNTDAMRLLTNMLTYNVGSSVLRDASTNETAVYNEINTQLNNEDYPLLSSDFNSINLKIMGGNYSYWDESDGELRPRTSWEFKSNNLSRYSSGNQVFPTSSNAINTQTINSYNSFGNMTQTTDAFGEITKYYYGTNSQPFSTGTLNGLSGVYMTGLQKVVGSIDTPAGGNRLTTGSDLDLYSEIEYDQYGRISAEINEINERIEHLYDSKHRLVATINENGNLIQETHYSNATINLSGISSTSVNSTSTNTFDEAIPVSEIIASLSFDNSNYEIINGIDSWFGAQYSEGYFGAGAYFDGDDDGVDLYDIDALDTPSTFSVSLWFNREADQTSGTNHGVYNVLFSQFDNLEVGSDGGSIQVYMRTPSNNIKKTTSAGIENNQWYHLVLTYSASQEDLSLYLDGEYLNGWDNWTQPLTNSGNASFIIGNGELGNGDFKGIIDEVKIFNSQLDPDQVRALYESTQSIVYSDGLGREIQVQSRSGEQIISSGTLYDSRGLKVAKSRPFSTTNSIYDGYINNVFGSTYTVADPANPLISGPVFSYYNNSDLGNDPAYAFSQIKYESGALARVTEASMPGSNNRIGSNNENETIYGINETETFSTSAQGYINSITWAPDKLFKTISVDSDNKQTITYTNGKGQTIASGVDMDQNGTLTRSVDLVTEYVYDHSGNLVRVEDPRGLSATYTYNSRNQLIEKNLPDQTHPHTYKYDDKGRLRFHRDPNLDASGNNYYYTKYDDINRVTEVGKYNSSSFFDNITYINNQDWPTTTNTPYIYYNYDGEWAFSGANNLEGNLTQTVYKDEHGTDWGYTWYSYNSIGQVEWVVQEPPGFSSSERVKIEYEYDELGRLERLYYNPLNTSSDDHYFWFDYDGQGRLETVKSHHSNTEYSAQKEAEYIYNADGQTKQLILGNGVQTIDYDYTIQGWLDDINNGSSGGGDVFSQNLSYELNGNLKTNQWYQMATYSSGLFPIYAYNYDNANRLTEACYGSWSTCPETSLSTYDVKYTYDKNGNLETLNRLQNTGSNDQYLDHQYLASTNKINRIYLNGSPRYFSHDANGNVTQNAVQGITSTTYDWRNLPTQIVANGTTIEYQYDADGKRVKKDINGGQTTYFIRGVDGQAIATYDGSGNLMFLNILVDGQVIGQIIKN